MKRTIVEFVNEGNKIHNFKYDYRYSIYKNADSRLKIICPIHGEFIQRAHSHLVGYGCKKCSDKLRVKTNYIEKCSKIHDFKYDYSNTVYTKSSEKVKINCKIHGEFEQRAGSHLAGQGCPRCAYELKGHSAKYFKNKPTTLYYIKINDLYKIGITTTSTKKRFQKQINFEIIDEFHFDDGAKAFLIEKNILKDTAHLCYKGKNILKSGNTEIRTEDIKRYFNKYGLL